MKIVKVMLIVLLSVQLMSQVAFADKRVFPASVPLLDAQGNNIGSAVITELEDRSKGVNIHLEASHLSPGVHAIHIHELGKCEPPDFSSAGGHFNPEGKQHGFHNPHGFHSGDLPNIIVGEDGTVKVDIQTKAVTLEEGKPHSLRRPNGTSIIIHEKADDFQTDPAGDSGKRIACGVIQ